MTGEIAAMRAAVLDLVDEFQCPSGGPVCSDSSDCSGGAEALYESVWCAVGTCSFAGCAESGRGCGGFRESSLAIMVVITDEGDECFFGGWPFAECEVNHMSAGRALHNFGAIPVGIDADVGREATPFLEALAEEADTFGPDGAPLVFAGAEENVVDAVRQGLGEVPFTPLPVRIEREDLEGVPNRFLDSIEVDTESRGCFPYDELEGTDRDGQLDTVSAAGPGTTACFDVRFRPARSDSEELREHRVEVQVVVGSSVVERQEICIVAP